MGRQYPHDPWHIEVSTLMVSPQRKWPWKCWSTKLVKTSVFPWWMGINPSIEDLFNDFFIFSVPSIRNLIVGWMTMTKHTMLSPTSAPLFRVAQLTRWFQFKFAHESYCFQVDTGNGTYKNYIKSTFWIGKSTISKWGIFNSKLLNYQRVVVDVSDVLNFGSAIAFRS